MSKLYLGRFRLKTGEGTFLDEVMEREGRHFVNGRRVETGIVTEKYTYEFNSNPDSTFSPTDIAKKAVRSIIRKNPGLIDIVNGYIENCIDYMSFCTQFSNG